VLREWAQSGLSASAFALRKGITATRLSYWQERAGGDPENRVDFVAVPLSAGEATSEVRRSNSSAGVIPNILSGSVVRRYGCCRGDHCYSYFMYAKSGHADHLEAKLRGYKLASAMCDGSPTNNCVERAGATRGGCNSHARRGLVEALRGGDDRALAGLEMYARIFHVDGGSKRAGENIEQRFARRQHESAALVQELRAWVDARLADVEPKSTLGKALRYMNRQWRRLTQFLRDPRMELTNNEIERDLRTWVLDRKT
jgi:hypothetical protein